MIPLQEVDIHTNQNVFYKLHLIAPTGAAPFSVEVLLYDSEFDPPFQSHVSFSQQFQNASAAFTHALNWVQGYCAQHGYSIKRINNPCNCEFLQHADQQQIVEVAELSISVEVNGE